MLGKDSDRSEYWFFKEEPKKLFVKKYITNSLQSEVLNEPQKCDKDNKMMIDDEN